MRLAKERKKSIINDFKLHSKDTGSTAVQIALLTQRINDLTEHLRRHRRDFSSRRSLLVLVGRRRRLLEYLKRNDLKEYLKIAEKLHLKK
ncbi:MAG: 30S ribosomal protein S15 [Candidatus Omnitrophica bacterium]|nr:30S ribosomal protein S15 [Candidatus Omnitrophota bacterium]